MQACQVKAPLPDLLQVRSRQQVCQSSCGSTKQSPLCEEGVREENIR